MSHTAPKKAFGAVFTAASRRGIRWMVRETGFPG